MALKITQIFGYLNKMGLADQIHIRDGDEFVFYHWNAYASDLIPSITVRANYIERYYYPRSVVPLLYRAANTEIVNDLNETHKFVRDKRSLQNDRN